MPILLIIFGYSFDKSVGFSYCIVLGNALSQTIINIRKVHPFSMRHPLIFWELIIVLLPAQMGGGNIGSLLSKILPESILYIFAFIVLFYGSTLSLRKGIHKWQHETELKDKIHRQSIDGQKPSNLGLEQIESATVANPLASEKKEASKESFSMEAYQDLDPKFDNKVTKSRLSSIVEVDGVVQPVLVMQVIAAVWISYTLMVVGMNEVAPCSAAYASIFVLLYIPLLSGIIWGVYYNTMLVKTLIPKGCSEPLKPANELDFSKIAFIMPAVSFIIGIACSLLGIGGGELFGPLMMTFGVIPQVQSAATATLDFLNTSTNVVRSIAQGTLDYKTGAILFFVGAFAGGFGRFAGLYIADKGRPSVIIFCLVTAMYVTCIYYIYELSSTSMDSSITQFC